MQGIAKCKITNLLPNPVFFSFCIWLVWRNFKKPGWLKSVPRDKISWDLRLGEKAKRCDRQKSESPLLSLPRWPHPNLQICEHVVA